METKTNIAELLKDCPQGMELDCTMYENVTFEEVVGTIDCDGNEDVNIILLTHYNDGTDDAITLTNYGTYTYNETAKCVIFPKGKTTWEGFVPPCKFKDGDILSYQYTGNKNRTIYIYMQHSEMNTTYYVALSGNDKSEFMVNYEKGHALNSYNKSVRLATEEEKAKLFKAIKDNGYRWNAETKTLEKLIEPKFKVGDRIKLNNSRLIFTITDLLKDRYRTTVYSHDLYEIKFERQDAYKLVPDKFDITTLKPYDKVLYRMHDKDTWCNSFYSFYKSPHHFITSLTIVRQCVPYEGNEHLLGTTNDCDEYYKTW